MLIKKAVYETRMVEQTVLVSDEVHGCDHCAKVIPEYPNELLRLELTVFYQEGETQSLHFCSWKCVLQHLPNIKTDFFIDLPHLFYDRGHGEGSATELINLLKNL